MKIIIPKHSGFCYGVKRSVSEAFLLAGAGSVYMYGEVVHNPQVVARLQAAGMTLVHDLAEIPPDAPRGTKVLIRAHGVPPAVIQEIEDRGLVAVDMTCPHVKKIHAIVAYAAARGMDVIVCGTPNHPEVAGIVARVTTRAMVLRNAEEARGIIPGMEFSPDGVCLVAQTTHNRETYEQLHAYLTENIRFASTRPPILEPHDTICEATTQRQNELRKLAQTADVCIISGGKNSSNVTKLYEIACGLCPIALHIETVEELKEILTHAPDTLKDAHTIVVAGGASTPHDTVRAVRDALEQAEAPRKF